MNYIGLIRKEGDSSFGVEFPDFPGCISGGETLEEARNNAQEALVFHVEGVIEDGEALPIPASLDAVMSDPENRTAVAILVDLPDSLQKSVRINITMPELELKRIDASAKAAHLNRSAFLLAAARNFISAH